MHAFQSCPTGIGSYKLFVSFAEVTQWLIDNYLMAAATVVPPSAAAGGQVFEDYEGQMFADDEGQVFTDE